MADVVLAADIARGAGAEHAGQHGVRAARVRGHARTVFVAADLNGWDSWTTRLARRGDRWVGRAQLAPGTYGYRFVVDDTTWVRDPANPRTGGDPQDPHSMRVVPAPS